MGPSLRETRKRMRGTRSLEELGGRQRGCVRECKLQEEGEESVVLDAARDPGRWMEGEWK
jgi:hypothetical protein